MKKYTALPALGVTVMAMFCTSTPIFAAEIPTEISQEIESFSKNGEEQTYTTLINKTLEHDAKEITICISYPNTFNYLSKDFYLGGLAPAESTSETDVVTNITYKSFKFENVAAGTVLDKLTFSGKITGNEDIDITINGTIKYEDIEDDTFNTSITTVASKDESEDKEDDDSIVSDFETLVINLPSASDLSLSDKENVSTARQVYDDMDESHKAQVSEDSLNKLNELEVKLKELEAEEAESKHILNQFNISTNPLEVEYLDEIDSTITEINTKEGKDMPKSIVLEANISDRLLLDSIILPKFENASYVLEVNGNIINTDEENVNISDTIESFKLTITPNEDATSIVQTKGMIFNMRSTKNETGTGTINYNLKALDEKGTIIDVRTAQTDISFSAVVIPDPEPEPDPQPQPTPDPTPIDPNPTPTPDPTPVTPDTDKKDQIDKTEDKTDDKKEDNKTSTATATTEKKKIVVNLTGHDTTEKVQPTSSPVKNSVNSKNGLNSVASVNIDEAATKTSSLISSISSGDDTEDIIEYETDDNGTTYEVNRSDSSKNAKEISEDEAPAEKVEETKEKKKTTFTNMVLPIVVIVAGCAAIAVGVIYKLFDKKPSESDNDTKKE